MRNIALPATMLGLLAVCSYAAPAQAQVSRSWVSGVGDDINPCSRTAPCKTYAKAISVTANNGEINCLDPGGFGALTITKSVSVVCDYTEGGVLASLTHGFTINMAASGNIVTLKGQDVECFINGINGVRILGAGVTVHIHKSQFRNCRGGGSGVNIAPSSGSSLVFIADSYITNNGNSSQQGGILVRPTGGAQVNVVVTNTKIEANTNGIFMDAAGGGGTTHLNMTHSVVSGNSTNGVSIFGTGATFNATVADSLISSNSGSGIGVAGAGASAKIGNNTITHNVTGVSGAAVQSFKNNQIADNTADGTPITAVISGGFTLN